MRGCITYHKNYRSKMNVRRMNVRKTKIVCTIGPASDSVETLKQLIENGMDVARLNFSHGNYTEHQQRISNIRQAAEEMNQTVSILLDTRGPEIRNQSFKGGHEELERGATVSISMSEVEGTAERFSVTYQGLIDDVKVGTIISLDDGLIELKVQAIDHEKGE